MLNEKRKRFCQEYIKDFNGSESAIRAGYSKKTARQEAYQLLSDPDVENYLKKLQDKSAKRNEITIDELIQDLAQMKNVDIADFYDEAGNLKDLHEMDKHVRRCIQEITETSTRFGRDSENERTVTKLKMYSQLDAIEKLAKHLGFYEKDNSQSKPEIKIELPYAIEIETRKKTDSK